MKKKLLSVIMALCMVIGMLPMTVFALDETPTALSADNVSLSTTTAEYDGENAVTLPTVTVDVTGAEVDTNYTVTWKDGEGQAVTGTTVSAAGTYTVTVAAVDQDTVVSGSVELTFTVTEKQTSSEVKPENPTVVDGAATVAPTEDQMADAINAAKDDPAKTVTVSVEKAGTDLKSGTANIPKASVSSAVTANVSYALDVAGVGGVKLSKEALEKVATAIGGENSASVSVAKADTIAEPEGVTIADNKEVSATFEAEVSVNGTAIDWDTGVAGGITLTFQIANGLTQGDISVYYVPDTGDAEEVTVTSYDAATGLLTVTVDHLSTYSIVTPKVVAPEEFDITKAAATNGSFTVKVGTDEVLTWQLNNRKSAC